jgi:hypothetical protein
MGHQLKYSQDCFFHILPNALLTNHPKNSSYIVLITERIITQSTNKQNKLLNMLLLLVRAEETTFMAMGMEK